MPQILTSANLPNYASDPSSPNEGDVYFNTATNSVRVYVNSTALSASRWVDLAGYQVETFTAGSTTWTRPSNVSYLKFMYAIGAGGGGGNGQMVVGATADTVTSAGGQGGFAGAIVAIENLYIGGSSTISVSVASGGTGATQKTFTKAAAATTTSNQAATLSTAASGATTFGSYCVAYGGSSGVYATADSIVYGATLRSGPSGGAAGAAGANAGGAGMAQYISTMTRIYSSTVVTGNSPTAASGGVTSGSTTNITTTLGSTVSAATTSIPNASGGGSGGTSAGRNPSAATVGAAGVGGAGGGGSAGASVAMGMGGTTAVTINLTAGAGANGGIGSGGGASGSLNICSLATQYNASTITATIPAGGNGGDGRIYIAYVA